MPVTGKGTWRTHSLQAQGSGGASETHQWGASMLVAPNPVAAAANHPSAPGRIDFTGEELGSSRPGDDFMTFGSFAPASGTASNHFRKKLAANIRRTRPSPNQYRSDDLSSNSLHSHRTSSRLHAIAPLQPLISHQPPSCQPRPLLRSWSCAEETGSSGQESASMPSQEAGTSRPSGTRTPLELPTAHLSHSSPPHHV